MSKIALICLSNTLMIAATRNDLLDKWEVPVIKLVNEVQNLEDGQFVGRTDIFEAVISNVDEIPSFCFSGCVNLRKVTIRGECSSVGFEAFKGCTSLEEVLAEDGCSSEQDDANLHSDVEDGHPEKVGVTIRSNAFEGCASLRRVDLLERAIEIRSMAFKGCASLVDIRLGSRLEKLEKSAFLGCDLSSLSVEGNQRYSLEGGFLLEKGKVDKNSDREDCRALHYVGSSSSPMVPRGVTLLSDLCFSGSTISELSLPPALLSLDDVGRPGDEFTIGEMGSLDGELVVLPHSGSEAFYDPFRACGKLERFRLQKGSSAFSVAKGALYSKDREMLLRVPPAWDGSDADGNDPGAEGALVFAVPEGTKEIMHFAFSGCSKITDVILPSTLETIG